MKKSLNSIASWRELKASLVYKQQARLEEQLNFKISASVLTITAILYWLLSSLGSNAALIQNSFIGYFC
jgi:hypothetical protein